MEVQTGEDSLYQSPHGTFQSWYAGLIVKLVVFFLRNDIPQLSGYSPRRHWDAIDLILDKKDKSPLINKKRTIGLLDT